MTMSHILPLGIAFVGGGVLGLLYLILLRESVRSFLDDHRAGLGAVLTVGRLLLVGAGLWLAVQSGALQLLGALAGFTVIRAFGMHSRRGFSWT